MFTTTGNAGLDAFADAIADRVMERIRAAQEPAFIDARECGRRLGRSRRSVLELAAKGVLPSHRQGRRVMFKWRDVERTVEAEKAK